MSEESKKSEHTRRDVLRMAARGGALAALAGVGAAALPDREDDGDWVWQIDPQLCMQCGNCATYCVLKPSAVKCVHDHSLCGYCDLCFAYYNPRTSTKEAPEVNGQCPTDAIRRAELEEPYYEYRIDEEKCIGCGICVKGCQDSGNGSLYLQIKQDLCVHCNECAIAAACPMRAIRRVPASQPYTHRKRGQGEEVG